MAVPVPTSNDVFSWKFLLRRLARSFRHRAPTDGFLGEGFMIFMCFVKFTALYPQLLYRFGAVYTWPVNGYATWINRLAKLLDQGGATYISGNLLTTLTAMCNNLDESRYTT